MNDKVEQERQIAEIKKDMYGFKHKNDLERLSITEKLILLRFELGKKLIGLKDGSARTRFEEQLTLIEKKYGLKRS